jgi:DMSO/TMAO reductase YedYZ molybdopterin-dependent catalytic subunit
MPGKARIVVLQDRPLVAQTPENMLDDDTTPTDKFYVRNNGLIPEIAGERNAWRFKVDGEVNTPLELTLGELRQRFTSVKLYLQLECGGNGRSSFVPEARGNQWENGGMGCARWTGVRLRDVLRAAGLKPSASTPRITADPTLAGQTDRPGISRSVRLARRSRSAPARLRDERRAAAADPWRAAARSIPAGRSASHKWLTRIWIRDASTTAPACRHRHRVAINPMVPGGTTPDTNLRILESMPVRSIITNPASGAEFVANSTGTRRIDMRGAAWAGDFGVRLVEVTTDYGRTWQRVRLGQPRNKYDWQRWTHSVTLPRPGFYEIWVRATDTRGITQPFIAGDWNPQGYGANPYHRIAVRLGA